jgi:EpsI family protein
MPHKAQIRNLKIIFFILLIAVGGAYWFDFNASYMISSIDLKKIGIEIGAWEGADYSVGLRDQARVSKGNMVVRRYRNGKNSLYLVAIQERGDRHRVHSPINCYTGSGWSVLEKNKVRVGKKHEKNVRRILVGKDENARLAYYWFTNGQESCATFTGHLLLYLKGAFFHRINHSWVYFDVSADVVDTVESTDKFIQSFIAEVEKRLSLTLPKRQASQELLSQTL